MGADLVLAAARDDERVGADVIDVIVADVGDVLLAAGDLPGARPHALELGAGEFGGGIAFLRYVLAAEVGIALAGGPGRRGDLVARDDFLRGLGRAAGLTGLQRAGFDVHLA